MSEELVYYKIGRFSLAKIEGIKLSFYDAIELRRKATAIITEPQTYDEYGIVIPGGVIDTRLGVCNSNQICGTCGLNNVNCKGHMGIIELPFPVYHSELINYTYNIFKHICLNCYHVQPWGHYSSGIIQSCKECKHELPIVKLSIPTTILVNDKIVYADYVEDVFNKTELSEIQKLRPIFKNYNPAIGILHVLGVGNTLMRPSLILESNKTSEADLTHKYADITRTIIKYNKTNIKNLLQSTKMHFINLLQYHVTTLFNNSTSGIPPAQHRNGKVLVGIVERIKGKEGRFRKHLAGKRVNFAARAVITPSIYIDIDVVGFPRSIANKLSKPMYVNLYNQCDVLKLYENGDILYVVKEGRKMRVLSINKDILRESIIPGNLVYRKLMDGDNIILNRNPTLLPQSMLGFKIKLHDYSTFQLHPSVCVGFNADADGDEVNVHILQNEEAEVECELLLNATSNVTLLKSGHTILGVTKDTIGGLYKLVNTESLTPYEVSCLMTHVVTPRFKGFNKIISGKQLFSTLLPEDLTITLEHGSNVIEIIDGNYIRGHLTKGIIGSEGLLHDILYGQYGQEVYTKFVKNATLLGISSATYYGISYSLNDLMHLKTESIPHNLLDLTHTLKTYESMFTTKIKENKHMNPYIIADSGTSGNVYTLLLNILYTGHQNENNWEKFENMNFINHRLLKEENFIHTSMLEGMDSMQYFSAAITARLALIDVFCRTATVGYASRKMLNGLEEYTIKGDGSIRNSKNEILSLLYDNTGLDYNKLNIYHQWVDLSAYYKPSVTKSIVTEKQIKDAYVCLLNTHIGSMANRFIRGMIRYLISNGYDPVKSLLEFTHYEEVFEKYAIAPGTPIGLVTGQSLAEPVTQMNLNTKHNLEDSSLGSAVEKLLELIYHSKNIKLPFIKLITHVDNKQTIDNITKSLVEIKIKDVAKIHIDIAGGKYVLKFDCELLLYYNISVKEIVDTLSVRYELINYNDKETSFKLSTKSFTNILITHTHMLNETIKGISMVKAEQIIKVNKIEVIFHNLSIKACSKLLSNYNFKYELRTNQINSLYKMYGLLTAMHYLKKEIKETFDSQGLNILDAHIDLIVNAMCISGSIKGISRSGIVADKSSFLAKAGFEIANKVIINSAVKNDIDLLGGLYENTMLGKYIKAGCASNRLYIIKQSL